MKRKKAETPLEKEIEKKRKELRDVRTLKKIEEKIRKEGKNE